MFPKVRIYTMVCVIVSIMALVLLQQTSAIEILDCGPGTPLVVEEASTNFEVNCINIHQGFEVFWYLNWTQDHHPMHMEAVHCLRKVMCIRNFPYVSIHRTPYTIALNLSEFIKFFRLSGITCKEHNPYGGQENSYTCNISIKTIRQHQAQELSKGLIVQRTYQIVSKDKIYTLMSVIFGIMVFVLLKQSSGAPEMSCNVVLLENTAIGIGVCNITKLHHQEKSYTCTWFKANENSKETTEIIRRSVINYKEQGTHFSGTCGAIFPLPSGGKFIYEVLLQPGGHRVLAVQRESRKNNKV